MSHVAYSVVMQRTLKTTKVKTSARVAYKSLRMNRKERILDAVLGTIISWGIVIALYIVATLVGY